MCVHSRAAHHHPTPTNHRPSDRASNQQVQEKEEKKKPPNTASKRTLPPLPPARSGPFYFLKIASFPFFPPVFWGCPLWRSARSFFTPEKRHFLVSCWLFQHRFPSPFLSVPQICSNLGLIQSVGGSKTKSGTFWFLGVFFGQFSTTFPSRIRLCFWGQAKLWTFTPEIKHFLVPHWFLGPFSS